MLALSCGQRADDRAVEELARSHMEAADVLLFVDYAEAQNQLAAIAAAIEAANAAGHRLRLVATCRASAVSTVQQTLEDLGVRRLMLAGAESGPHAGAYLDWVVRRILAHGGIETIAGLAAVCAGLPVLAAFALHLHEDRPETFARLFQGLAAETSFEQWARRRIALTLKRLGGSRAEVLRRTAEIAAMLPLSVQETQRLRVANDAASAIVDAFVADGWFDDDEGALLAAHDVFADALLAAHMFEAGIQPQPRARAMLREAQAAGALGRALAALDRLAGHGRFGELDGAALMRSVREQDPQALAAVAQALLRSRLLAPAGLVGLIAEDAALARELAEDPACHGPLSYLAERLARSGDESLRARGAVVIEPILEVALDRDEQRSNLLLRRAFALDPDRFAERALAEMRGAPDDHQTHFLIVAWLKAGRSPDAVAAVVNQWLLLHAWSNRKASFVFDTWLNESEDAEAVRSHLSVWLDRHGDLSEASYVYRAWLKAKGGIEPIARDVRRWLDCHAELGEARFVYTAWLDAGGGAEAVAPDMRRWLFDMGRFPRRVTSIARGSTPGAASMRSRTTFAAGSTVMPRSRRRITSIGLGSTPGAMSTRSRRTSAAGSTAMPRSPRHGSSMPHGSAARGASMPSRRTSAAGSTTMPTLLRRVTSTPRGSTPRAALTPSRRTRRWLDRYANIPEAQFVYRAWLHAKGGVDAIAQDVRRWLELHRGRDDIDHVMAGWANAGGNFDVIEEFAFAWLRRNLKRPEPLHLLKFILRQPNLPLGIVADAAVWCRIHADNPECVTRLGTLLTFYAKDDARAPLTDIALDVLERIEPGDLANEFIRAATIATIGQTAWIQNANGDFKATPGLRLRAVHAYLLQESDMYRPGLYVLEPSFMRKPPLVHHVAHLVQSGALNRAADRDKIEQFVQWLATWPADEKPRIASAVIRLAKLLYRPDLAQRIGFPNPNDASIADVAEAALTSAASG
ncbi:MAG: hypothetical protein ACJ8DH_16755 [Microvirga sp.]